MAGKGREGIIGVDVIGQIRRAYFEQQRPIKEIFPLLLVSRQRCVKLLEDIRLILDCLSVRCDTEIEPQMHVSPTK